MTKTPREVIAQDVLGGYGVNLTSNADFADACIRALEAAGYVVVRRDEYEFLKKPIPRST